MARFLRNASPEAYFLFSAFLGVLMAALASRIPGLDLSFVTLLVIFIALDLITYIAMKIGWIKTPKQRSGLDQ